MSLLSRFLPLEDSAKHFNKRFGVEKQEERLVAGLATCTHTQFTTLTKQLFHYLPILQSNHMTRVACRHVTWQNTPVQRVTEWSAPERKWLPVGLSNFLLGVRPRCDVLQHSVQGKTMCWFPDYHILSLEPSPMELHKQSFSNNAFFMTHCCLTECEKEACEACHNGSPFNPAYLLETASPATCIFQQYSLAQQSRQSSQFRNWTGWACRPAWSFRPMLQRDTNKPER